MKTSRTRISLDPRPPHSQILNSGGEILPAEAVLQAAAPIDQEIYSTKTDVYECHGRQKSEKSGILEPFIPVDLFGSEITEAAAIPVISVDECGECGSNFERTHRMGRPVRFCGEDCRRSHAARQRRAWNAAPAPSPVSACRRCGKRLEIRRHGPGRARQFCSRHCLLHADDPPVDTSDLFCLPASKPKG